MEIKIYDNYIEMSKVIAKEIADCVRLKPDAVLCLAAGHTSLSVFEQLIALEEEGRVSFRECRFVGLDEWAGMGIGDDGSCIQFMKNNLLDKLRIEDDNIIFYNGKGDLSAECKRIDDFLKENGPIDYVLLGMGMNGHLGLNEPGSSFDCYSHVVELDETTKMVGQKYFKQYTALSGGITMGMLHFRDAVRCVLMVSGRHKAEIVRKFVTSDISEAIPATYLKSLEHSALYLDKGAAAHIE